MNTISPHPDKVSFSVVVDPFNPKNGLELSFADGGCTVDEFVRLRYPDTNNFPAAVVCIKNGEPLLRARWSEPLTAGDAIIFVPALGDVVTIIIYLVVIIIGLVVALVVSANQSSAPDTSIGDTPEADPTFDLRGQHNQNKLSNPIECAYGSFRSWPSFGAAPYSSYFGNNAYLYQLFCLGHGTIDVDQIYIEDTPIEEFADIQYEILQPGEAVTLFPDNVFTSTEVGGIELFGPNEAAFTDWTAAFTVCPPLAKTTRIEVDVVLPRGMYFQSGGNLVNRTSTCEFEVRLIDDAGTAAGPWVAGVTFTKTLKTVTPQRYTLVIEVAEGRYEIRAVRTNNAETSSSGADQTFWRALRAFLPSVLTYSGVTMLAMKAKATNGLNDTASTRVNFTATRKLSVFDAESEVWVDNIPTTNPVWAFCDVFTSAYGGRLPREFLDTTALSELAEQLDSEGIEFSWVFDQKTTTWEAAKVIARVCRAIPILNGSKISMAREMPQVVPVAMFNPNNIIRDSFSYELKLFGVEDHDGLEVQYLNPATWQPETVLCLGPGDAGDKLKSVNFPGCTDRTRAYRLGMYMRMCEKKLRTNISFTTGLEGLLPGYADLIAVSHPLPGWGTGGYVVSINGDEVTLSSEVAFGVGTHYILLRKKDGSVFGPAICTAKYNDVGALVPKTVIVSDTITPADFYDGAANADPATFMFGTSTTYAKLATVAELVPQGGEEVNVKCLVYDGSVFDYDLETPPAINAGFYLPGLEAIPIVRNLEVFSHPQSTSQIVITWGAVRGITRYVVETSNDGETYNTVATPSDPFHVLTVEAQHLWVRVSATNVGTGSPAEWNGEVGIALTAPNNVAGLALAVWDGLDLVATWTAIVAGASIDGYIARVFTRPNGGNYKLARSMFVETNEATYTYAMAVEDGAVNREAKMLVTAVNIFAESATAASDTQDNPVPTVLTELVVNHESTTGSVRKWRISWEASPDTDLAFYRVWLSSTNGFTVGSNNVVYEGTDTSFVVEVPATYNPPFSPNSPARYWRVAALDVWGTEFTESAQKTIPAIVNGWP